MAIFAPNLKSSIPGIPGPRPIPAPAPYLPTFYTPPSAALPSCLAWAFGAFVTRGTTLAPAFNPNVSIGAFQRAAAISSPNFAPFTVFIGGQWYLFQPSGQSQVAVYYCARAAQRVLQSTWSPSSAISEGTKAFSFLGGGGGDVNLTNAQTQLAAAQTALASAVSLTDYQNVVNQFVTVGTAASAAGADATASGNSSGSVAGFVAQIAYAMSALASDQSKATLASNVSSIQPIAQDALKQATAALTAATAAVTASAAPGVPAPVPAAPNVSVTTNTAPAASTSTSTLVVIGLLAAAAGGAGYWVYKNRRAA